MWYEIEILYTTALSKRVKWKAHSSHMTHSNDKIIEIISEHAQKVVSKIARVYFHNVHFNIATWQLHHNTRIRST